MKEIGQPKCNKILTHHSNPVSLIQNTIIKNQIKNSKGLGSNCQNKLMRANRNLTKQPKTQEKA